MEESNDQVIEEKVKVIPKKRGKVGVQTSNNVV